MQLTRVAFVAGIFTSLCVSFLSAHPMGNFSVNHYARILPHQGRAEIEYVLDLAEIPTFELLQKWNLQAASPRDVLDSRAAAEARSWVSNLTVSIGGHRVEPRIESTRMTLAEGVGGMKVMRVETRVEVKGGPGKLEYEDRNYPERTGWKEIVIGSGPDKSQALTAYPTDPTVPQPQELRASADIAGGNAPSPTPSVTSQTAPAPAVEQTQPRTPTEPTAAPQPPPTSATPPQSESMGSLKRGDYLSRVLHGGEISFSVGLLSLLVAFGLGALHAFEPGHGKTMVAAYLVGSRGTPKHAVLLGFMTTFTHTISVFALGFVTLFLSHYIMPEKMTKVLGVISGLSIIWIGGLMLYRRSQKLMGAHSHDHHGHSHDHAHEHSHTHVHEHVPVAAHAHQDHDHEHQDHEHVHAVPSHTHEKMHSHDHGNSHDHGHSHSHDHSHPDDHGHSHQYDHDRGHSHSHDHDHPHSHDHSHSHDHGNSHPHDHDHAHPHHHMPEGDITVGSLIALGASGGLVPCPAALILLLTCISLGRPGFGVLLLLAFSIGLAIVLMATGLVVLYAKNFLPERHRSSDSGFMRAMPVVSAAIIVVVGVLMTGVSLGWLPAVRFLG